MFAGHGGDRTDASDDAVKCAVASETRPARKGEPLSSQVQTEHFLLGQGICAVVPVSASPLVGHLFGNRMRGFASLGRV